LLQGEKPGMPKAQAAASVLEKRLRFLSGKIVSQLKTHQTIGPSAPENLPARWDNYFEGCDAAG
jgi:hypothetical protein